MNNTLNSIISEKIMKTGADIPPSYASDISLAFSVLQKLHSLGWFWRLDSVHDGVICTVQAVPKNAKSLKERITFEVRSPTAAQAICECAARTVEHESGTP